MQSIFKTETKPKGLMKILGYTSLIALVFQLFSLGLFGISAVEAQGAPATLTVTKVVDGGTMLATDFDLFLDGMPIDTGVATTTLEAGTYTVTETAVAGYTGTFSGDCAADGTITLAAGATAECTLTNTFEAPVATTSLTVTKVIDGGDLVMEDVELFVNDTPVVSGVPLVFAPGTAPTAPLTVTETPVEGYTATFGGDCAADGTVTMEEGEEMECIVTNIFDAPTVATTSVTVIKVIEGGDLELEDVELFVNDTSVTSGEALVFDPLALPTAPLTISETPVDGYTATFSGDCAADGTLTLVEGEEMECIITNTFEDDDTDPTATTTSLTVNKIVTGGGDLDADDFDLFVNGVMVENGVATTTLAVGAYTITETENGQYDQMFSGDCDANGVVNLLAGVAAECTITNIYDPGSDATNNDDDDDNDRDININVTGGDTDVSDGDVNITIDDNGNPVPFTVFTPPGQVLGAQSVIPVPFSGQVLGAQSAVPGLPLTGGDPTAAGDIPNVLPVALAGILGIAGAALILGRGSSSNASGRILE